MELHSAVYCLENGEVEILLTSTLNKNNTLKPGTQVGLFHICKHPIRIANENQTSGKKN